MNLQSLTLRRNPRHRTIAISVLTTAAMLPAVDAAIMLAKAQISQTLIEHSWNTQGDAPWPWADTRPVARLVIPDLELDNYVLNGATGSVLAFAPGMVSGSSVPGSRGVTMIAAHRDTHFKSLQDITSNSLIRIQNADKSWHQYRVADIRIADSRVESIEPLTDDSRMILVTCYPFDALVPGGPLRFVVEASLEG